MLRFEARNLGFEANAFHEPIVAAMNASVSSDLMHELELALKGGSAEWRVRTLERLSDLLRSCAESLSPSQIGVFDDVLIRLLDCVGAGVLAELSHALAGLGAPPLRTARHLARHQDAAIAGPLLSGSVALVDAELIDIVKNRSQRHLAAVGSRPNLNEALTDVILKLAGRDALRALAKNSSATFSPRGLGILLAAAKRDEATAELLGLRPDLPTQALRSLLSGATDTARGRLLKAASDELKKKIQAELNSIGE